MTGRVDPGGGGLTGATGDLTPEAPDHAFEPGERREVEGADRDVHPPAGREDDRERETRIGGDERSDHEGRF